MSDIDTRADAPDIRARFLDAMSRVACSVHVVTTDGPAGRLGMTVSAMSSVSADGERPTVLVCAHHQSRSAAAIMENGVFCINVLRHDQSPIADCFAGRSGSDADKFACAQWSSGPTGTPRLDGALAAFECRLLSAERVGTHHVFIGAVEAVATAGSGPTLIYANRSYGHAVPLADPQSKSSAA